VGHEDGGRIEAEGSCLRGGGFDELGGCYEDAWQAEALEVGDVVHTARRAAASIGEGFDHEVALVSDLAAEVGGGGLGEGGLGVAADRGAAGGEVAG
jgi:hypothetical protein